MIEIGGVSLATAVSLLFLALGSVIALTLFIAYAHGAEEGYLFGPWTDVMFHLIFVSACWATTAFRINQAAERTATVTLVKTSSHPS